MSDRLEVSFELTCYEGESPETKALGIALEQTVELAADVISEDIRARIVGRIDRFEPLGEDRYALKISYPLATIGSELTQALNVLFGNISLKAGMRMVDIVWPKPLLRSFGGPRYGIEGLRELTGTRTGPLLCSALKPMGMSAAELAERAYQFARGGVQIIKDDHGVADQPDAPFAERLERAQAAIERANAETGGNSLYFPNVTAGYAELPRRLAAAKAAGCKGVLINAWVTGLDAMRYARDEFGLALMAHPALTGGYFASSEHGIAPELLLGDLFRVAGADASIYPNTGGRFGFSLATCEAINERLRRPLAGIKPSFPTPGGGMDIQRAPEWVRRYGPDTIVLIGGSLYAQGDLAAASRALREALEGL
jgi:ribulose-bisphosphate carboxylase large chain